MGIFPTEVFKAIRNILLAYENQDLDIGQVLHAKTQFMKVVNSRSL